MPQAPWKPRVLIVMPTFNEAENLPKIVPAVLDAAPVEVLVVDDSSPDGTGRLADEMAARDPRVHVLHRTTKDGLGRAYLAGFRWGIERGYDVLFEMDADFSHQPKYLPTMIRHTEDFDVVVGSRYIQGGGTENWGLHRRILSQGGGLYARSVLGVQVKDLTAGFIAWRRTALEAIDLDTVTTTGYGFQIDLKYRAVSKGLRLLETPITFPDRTAGESKMSARIFSEALTLVWKLRLGR
jgi:dolichol-phosphate mannosyltransferase